MDGEFLCAPTLLKPPSLSNNMAVTFHEISPDTYIVMASRSNYVGRDWLGSGVNFPAGYGVYEDSTN